MAKKKSSASSKKKSTSARKSTTRKSLKKRPKPPTKPSTVDGVLKSFSRQRVTLNSDLVAARKKIVQLTGKIAKMKDELETTKRKIVESETAIETLDDRRDEEVGTLLSEMGVNLSKAAAAAKTKIPVVHSAPLFDDNDSDANSSES